MSGGRSGRTVRLQQVVAGHRMRWGRPQVDASERMLEADIAQGCAR